MNNMMEHFIEYFNKKEYLLSVWCENHCLVSCSDKLEKVLDAAQSIDNASIKVSDKKFRTIGWAHFDILGDYLNRSTDCDLIKRWKKAFKRYQSKQEK